MPLQFSGQSGSSPNFEMLLEAFDEKKRVVVVTSQEALEDHGLVSVQIRASQKYDAGETDDAGRVVVFINDL